MLSDVCRDTATECVAADVFRGMTQIAADQLHTLAAVGTEEAVTKLTLGGAAVDDGNEVIGDDDSVLALSLWVFRYEGLFDDLHAWMVSGEGFVVSGRCHTAR